MNSTHVWRKVASTISLGDQRHSLISMQEIMGMAELKGIRGLDELSPVHMQILARIYAKGQDEPRLIGAYIGIDENEVFTILDCLERMSLVEADATVYKVTDKGEEAVKKVGEILVEEDSFKLKQHLKEVEKIRGKFV